MIKSSIHWKYIAVLNVYVPKNRAVEYVKPKLIELKEKIDKSTIIVEELVQHHSWRIDKTDKCHHLYRQAQQDHQQVLINIYEALYQKAEEYIFFSSALRLYDKVDHILGHKTYLNKFKITEIFSMFSDHNIIKQISKIVNKKISKHLEIQ